MKTLENYKNEYFCYLNDFDQIALNLERLKFNIIGINCDKENEKWHREQGKYHHIRVMVYLDALYSNLKKLK